MSSLVHTFRCAATSSFGTLCCPARRQPTHSRQDQTAANLHRVQQTTRSTSVVPRAEVLRASTFRIWTMPCRPRVCGGGPNGKTQLAAALASSPCLWGCSYHRPDVTGLPAVSPENRNGSTLSKLVCRWQLPPPRLRECSGHLQVARLVRPAFLAGAGIFRPEGRPSARRRHLPRASGDGPWLLTRTFRPGASSRASRDGPGDDCCTKLTPKSSPA